MQINGGQDANKSANKMAQDANKDANKTADFYLLRALYCFCKSFFSLQNQYFIKRTWSGIAIFKSVLYLEASLKCFSISHILL